VTDQIEIRFEIPEADASPKDMRALLLGQMLAYLDDEIENTHPDWVPGEQEVGRTPSPYWRALMRVDALRPVRGAVRSMLRTVEEQMVFDREISGLSPPREAELECARHHDRCTVCTDHGLVIHRMEREQRKLEEIRKVIVSEVGELLIQIDVDRQNARAGDGPSLTLADVEKQLRRTQAAAVKRLQRQEREVGDA
jgi:hypothetical protein